MILRLVLPLLVFVMIGGLLYAGLGRNPDIVPSPLIDKPAPQFSLPLLNKPEQRVSRTDLLGRPYLLNVWASWCYACRLEHDVITDIARSGRVAVYGLNYKDRREDAQRWLDQFGNPYAFSLYDLEGRTAMDFGVYKAPETFIIDADGTIRYKHIGPLSPEIVQRDILPLIEKLEKGEA